MGAVVDEGLCGGIPVGPRRVRAVVCEAANVDRAGDRIGSGRAHRDADGRAVRKSASICDRSGHRVAAVRKRRFEAAATADDFATGRPHHVGRCRVLVGDTGAESDRRPAGDGYAVGRLQDAHVRRGIAFGFVRDVGSHGRQQVVQALPRTFRRRVVAVAGDGVDGLLVDAVVVCNFLVADELRTGEPVPHRKLRKRVLGGGDGSGLGVGPEAGAVAEVAEQRHPDVAGVVAARVGACDHLVAAVVREVSAVADDTRDADPVLRI